MDEEQLPPRDHWYIACASAQLGRAPRAAQVMGHALALYRGADGTPRALLDRCSHRGVRLSLGRVEGDTLACGYHGWRFAGDGACVAVPSLARGRRVAAGCGVPALPCVEGCGYVWVWTGGPGVPIGPAPEITGFTARRWSQGSVEAACGWLAALENNLDWCHPVFAHRWTHGLFYMALLRGLTDTTLALTAVADGLRVDGPLGADGGPTRGALTLVFSLPCRAEIVGPGPRRIVVHCVPTVAGRCRMEWMMSRTLPLGPRVRFVAGEPVIFRQDRLLLESAVAAQEDADWRERSVEADAPTLLLRRIVALAARGEWDATRAAAEGRRLVRVRA